MGVVGIRARRASVALLLAVIACRSSRQEPTRLSDAEIAALLETGRSIPTDHASAARYEETWSRIASQTTDAAVRTEAQCNLGQLAWREKQLESARRWFEQATAAEDATVHRTISAYQLASLRYMAKEYAGALRGFDAYLAGNPNNEYWIAAAHYLRGVCLAELGRTDEARAALRAFVAANQPTDRYAGASVKAARALLERLGPFR